jgi:hypothetical protein
MRRADQAGDDIISGAAGAILGLLRVARGCEMPQLLNVAVRLGEELESRAHRSPIGWSWGALDAMKIRRLCGYAHGVAGIAHAFLELFAETGDVRWRFAASRGMAYERFHEIDKSGDWPDYRAFELARLHMRGDRNELLSRLRAGEQIQSREPGSFRAWCHGAPGIALTRIRALALGVDPALVAPELDRALAATRDSAMAGQSPRGHSLCHGILGNLESLLLARERLGLLDDGSIESIVERLLASYGRAKRPWITGVPGGVYDPSLFVGEAGIGLSLLRFASPAPASVLCLSNWRQPATEVPDTDAIARVREVEHLLPTVSAASKKLPSSRAHWQEIVVRASASSDIAAVVSEFGKSIAADSSPDGEILRDALSIDVAVLDEDRSFDNLAEQFCRVLLRPTPDETHNGNTWIEVSPGTRFVRTKYNWSAWLAEPDAAPSIDEECFVIYRATDRVEKMSATALESAVLEAISDRAPLDEIVARVLSDIDCDPDVASELPAEIRRVIQDALAIGVLSVVRAAPTI